MTITKSFFGKTSDGQIVDAYKLTSGKIELTLITYGGRWVSLITPDAKGDTADIALSMDNITAFEGDNPYLGALIGRCGNRIGNAKFFIDALRYKISPNNGVVNHLHGGYSGFDKKVWTADIVSVGGVDKLKLSLISDDGEEGYPGRLSVSVTHYISDNGALELEYEATSDKDTICNLTQHNYFNLAGHNNGDILGHELIVYANGITEVDANLIPTGNVPLVAGTVYDFGKSKAIGKDITSSELKSYRGYDVNFVLTPREGLRKAAIVKEPKSGRVMEVWTTKPSIQLYTGNYFDGLKAKGGAVYNQYAGFALETQYAPDSVNNMGKPGFDDAIVLRKGQAYKHRTDYRFFVTE